MAERREERAKVLITGGTGFIGSYLAMDLLKKGNEVVVADRSYDLRRIEGFKDEFEKNKDRLTFIQGDLSLSEHVHQWFDEFRPQSVYHLGALLSAGAETNPTQGFLTDLQGSWHVLEAARLQRQRKKSGPVKVIFPAPSRRSGCTSLRSSRKRSRTKPPSFPQPCTGMPSCPWNAWEITTTAGSGWTSGPCASPPSSVRVVDPGGRPCTQP